MDTVKLEMRKDLGPAAIAIVTENTDGVRSAVNAIPADEWTQLRSDVKAHYQLDKSTRVDCINIITALTIALTDR